MFAFSYLSKYADPTDEPSSVPYDQSFEDMDLPVEKWKSEYSRYLTKFSQSIGVMKVMIFKSNKVFFLNILF